MTPEQEHLITELALDARAKEIVAYIQSIIDAAIAAEREECAKLCSDIGQTLYPNTVPTQQLAPEGLCVIRACAAAIRARAKSAEEPKP